MEDGIKNKQIDNTHQYYHLLLEIDNTISPDLFSRSFPRFATKVSPFIDLNVLDSVVISLSRASESARFVGRLEVVISRFLTCRCPSIDAPEPREKTYIALISRNSRESDFCRTMQRDGRISISHLSRDPACALWHRRGILARDIRRAHACVYMYVCRNSRRK